MNLELNILTLINVCSPTAPMALFVDAAFLDVLRNEFYRNNIHTGATMIPGYLALVDAIDFKGVLQHYALPCNNRRELKEWAKEHLLENYAFTWREGSIEEIRKAGCLWIEDGDGKIDAYERIRLRDTPGPLYLLDEEVLMLREFEYACQVRVKNLIVLDPSPRLSWIPKTGLHMFPCEHCESGAGRDDYVPWFSKYLIELRRHLAFTPSTLVLLDMGISSSCISEATDKCELCFKAYLKELTRFQWLFIRKMEEEIAAVSLSSQSLHLHSPVQSHRSSFPTIKSRRAWVFQR